MCGRLNHFRFSILFVLSFGFISQLLAAEYEIQPATNALEDSSRSSKAIVKIIKKPGHDIVDIASAEWHGGAIKLFLKHGKWPNKMIIRLHAGDGTRFPRLESVALSTRNYKINARSGRKYHFPLYQNNNGTWVAGAKIRLVISLQPAYIKIEVPKVLLHSNTDYLKIAWIYMYSLQ